MSIAQEVAVPQRLAALCKEYAGYISDVRREAESLIEQWIESQPTAAGGGARGTGGSGSLDVPVTDLPTSKPAAELKKTPLRSRREQELARLRYQAGKPGGIARARLDALVGRYLRLKSAVEQLIRALSQQIEHAGLDFADHIELEVRLADLQGRLEQADIIVGELDRLAN